MGLLTKIERDIAADESLTLEGPVEITGNIGARSSVNVTGGTLLVKGNIAGHSNIRVKTRSDEKAPADANVLGITVEGRVSSSVFFATDASIRLFRDAGEYINAVANGNFIATDIAEGLSGAVTGNFVVQRLGGYSAFTVHGDTSIGQLGENSLLLTHGNVVIGTLGDGAEVLAQKTVDISETGADAKVTSDGDITIGFLGFNANATSLAGKVKIIDGAGVNTPDAVATVTEPKPRAKAALRP